MSFTLLHSAAFHGDVDEVRELMDYDRCGMMYCIIFGMHLTKDRYDINEVSKYDETPLQDACQQGHLNMARVLIGTYKADMTIQNKEGATALMLAIKRGHDNVAHALLEDYQCPVDIRDKHGDTVLHYACRANGIRSMKTLVQKYNAEKYLGNSGDKSLQVSIVARSGDVDKVRRLLKDSGCDVNVTDNKNWTPLHYACTWGELDMARMLIVQFKAGMTIQNSEGATALMLAIKHGHNNVAHALLEDYQYPIDICDKDGKTVLHYACADGTLNMARMLIAQFKADMTIQNSEGATALMLAIKHGRDNVAHALLEDYQCPAEVRDNNGDSVLHYACRANATQSMKTLIQKYKVDMYSRNNDNDTPLHVAALCGKQAVISALIKEFGCEVNCKGNKGRSVLHIACNSGNIMSVNTLVSECKADVNARNDNSITPLHEAAINGQQEVVLALIQEFGCDVNIKGYRGRSALHSACARGHVGIVKCLSKYISPLVVDYKGNTPLHTCCENGNSDCVEALLALNAPVLIRNNSGKTPKDVAKYEPTKNWLEQHMKNSTFLVRYDNIQKHAKKRYSSSEHITRIFVLGNPGAGKSSFIATLKREGFFGSLWRVSESSVPPHTAGIVPSIHTSKHYGRVLFYDFAGDAEYYSSHAAILENLASTRNGDNIFIIVVDLREDSHKISCLLNYWVSFIQYQIFKKKQPYLLILGSHLDLVQGNRLDEFEKLCESKGDLQLSGCFVLDCCNPKSKEVLSVVQHITSLVKDSPHYILSNEGTVLLGLLEKDFQHVIACPIQTIISHIEDTKVCLPTDIQSLCPILFELHELGLLFMIKGDNDVQLVLNMSRLSHDVHQLLFSEEAIERLREKSGNASLFHVGIISEAALSEVLPAHITKEILVQLQYCQVIHHKDVGTFSSSDQCDSSVQSYLFFPALCSAEKSDITWVTPPDLSYGIGWLARCTDPRDYFPPRFHHVLFLRLVFNFVLSDPTTDQPLGASPDHKYFPHYCKMWKRGVYWITKQGVECMVELKNTNTEVIVLTKAKKECAQKCTSVFNDVLCCIKKARAEFCHPINPEFFLLDMTNELDCVCDDNLFPLKVVTESSPQVVWSITRKREFPKQSIYLLFSLWHDTLSDMGYGIGWLARCSAPFPQQFSSGLFGMLIDRVTPKITKPRGSADQHTGPHQYRCTMWKTGLHWSMREGVECIVEMVHDNREVVIRVNSESGKAEVCATVIKELIQCVLEAKAEFCHTVRPQFFLLNSTSEADYLHPDNLFAMSEVNMALTSENIDVILSAEGKGKMKCSKVLWLRKLTHWDSFFPIDTVSVLKCLENVSRNLYTFGMYLGLSTGILDAIEKDFPSSTERQRTELVRRWLSSSLDPCWWHLAQALKQIQEGVLADDIERNKSKYNHCINLDNMLRKYFELCHNCMVHVFSAHF